MRVGFVGFGEAARTLAAGLQGAVSAMVAFCHGAHHAPPYDPEFRQMAARLGVELLDSLEAVTQAADVVISAVSPQAALPVATNATSGLGPRHLFVDVNAVAPAVKDAMAGVIGPTGARFVDCELMGSASLYGAKVPLYVSGDGAEAFHRLFAAQGLNVTVVGSRASAAATLKTMRSVVTKGMEAVLVEAMYAAHRAGVAREAFAVITEPMDAVKFSEFAKMCLTTDPIHAGRRADEMQGVSDVIRGLGVEPIMVDATRRRLAWSAAFKLRDALAGQAAVDHLEVLRLYDRLDQDRSPDPP